MMFKDINIVDLKNEINNLKTMISKRNIVPILGAGFSMGSKARNGFVPSAKEMEPPPSLDNKKRRTRWWFAL